MCIVLIDYEAKCIDLIENNAHNVDFIKRNPSEQHIPNIK